MCDGPRATSNGLRATGDELRATKTTGLRAAGSSDERRAASNERRAANDERRATPDSLEMGSPRPNKPMVPTATTWFDEHAPPTPRRHIGQPFGSGERRPNGQRVTATAPRGEQESGQRQETTSCV